MTPQIHDKPWLLSTDGLNRLALVSGSIGVSLAGNQSKPAVKSEKRGKIGVVQVYGTLVKEYSIFSYQRNGQHFFPYTGC